MISRSPPSRWFVEPARSSLRPAGGATATASRPASPGLAGRTVAIAAAAPESPGFSAPWDGPVRRPPRAGARDEPGASRDDGWDLPSPLLLPSLDTPAVPAPLAPWLSVSDLALDAGDGASPAVLPGLSPTLPLGHGWVSPSPLPDPDIDSGSDGDGPDMNA